MVLMTLVFAMATPLFTETLASARLQTDARQMASLLRLARQSAISSGQAKMVIFYPQNAKYKFGISFVGKTTFTMQVEELPACGFSPSGVPSSGGTVTLGNNNELLYVIVNPVAGRIRISNSPPINW